MEFNRKEKLKIPRIGFIGLGKHGRTDGEESSQTPGIRSSDMILMPQNAQHSMRQVRLHVKILLRLSKIAMSL